MSSGVRAKPTRYRVLVVDDEPAMLETTLAIVQSEHDAVGTLRPHDALRRLQTEPFQVVVTDWQMPSMDGIELSRAVYRLDLPVACLLMTGFMEELGEEVSFESRRLLGIIGKPYAPRELLQRIQELGAIAAMKLSAHRLRKS